LSNSMPFEEEKALFFWFTFISFRDLQPLRALPAKRTTPEPISIVSRAVQFLNADGSTLEIPSVSTICLREEHPSNIEEDMLCRFSPNIAVSSESAPRKADAPALKSAERSAASNEGHLLKAKSPKIPTFSRLIFGACCSRQTRCRLFP